MNNPPATAARLHRLLSGGWILAIALVVAAFLFINYKLLTGGGDPVWDGADLFFAMWSMVADAARAGQLAWWDPTLSGGTPQAADQYGVFSPVTVGLGLLLGGSLRGYCAYWLMNWAMGGLGMLALARRLGTPAWGAAVVAMGWLFSGTYIGHASHLPFLVGFSAMPWFFWRLEAGLEQRSMRPWVEAGAIWGLAGLSAYPATTILTPCLGGLWIVGRLIWPDRPSLTPAPTTQAAEFDRRSSLPRSALRAIGGLAIILLIGVLIMSPLLVTIGTEGRSYSARLGERSRAESISSNLLAPGALSAITSPYVPSIGGANPGLWPATDVTSTGLYAGASIYVLAVLALWHRRDRPRRWWALVLALICLLLALGSHTPVRGWLYDWFPPSRYFRHSSIFRVYAIFIFSILACWGAADLARVSETTTTGSNAEGSRTRSMRRWMPAVIAAVLGVVSIVTFERLVRSVPGHVPELTPARWHLLIVWPALTTIMAVIGMAQSDRLRRGAIAALLVLAVSDAACCQWLSRSVYDDRPATLQRWQQIARLRRADVDLTGSGLARVMRVQFGNNLSTHAAMIKVPAWEGYVTLLNPFLDRWLDEPVLNNAVLQPAPNPAVGQSRLWFSVDAVEVEPTLAQFDAFRAAAKQHGGLPAIIHRAESMPLQPESSMREPATTQTGLSTMSLSPMATRISARVTDYRLDRLALTVRTEHDGWLFVTDRWCAGWSARVNGQSAQLRPGMFLFRAVRVPAGESDVVMEYRNPAWPWMIILSWGCLAAVIAWSMMASIRTWQRRPNPTPQVGSSLPGAPPH